MNLQNEAEQSTDINSSFRDDPGILLAIYLVSVRIIGRKKLGNASRFASKIEMLLKEIGTHFFGIDVVVETSFAHAEAFACQPLDLTSLETALKELTFAFDRSSSAEKNENWLSLSSRFKVDPRGASSSAIVLAVWHLFHRSGVGVLINGLENRPISEKSTQKVLDDRSYTVWQGVLRKDKYVQRRLSNDKRFSVLTRLWIREAIALCYFEKCSTELKEAIEREKSNVLARDIADHIETVQNEVIPSLRQTHAEQLAGKKKSRSLHRISEQLLEDTLKKWSDSLDDLNASENSSEEERASSSGVETLNDFNRLNDYLSETMGADHPARLIIQFFDSSESEDIVRDLYELDRLAKDPQVPTQQAFADLRKLSEVYDECLQNLMEWDKSQHEGRLFLVYLLYRFLEKQKPTGEYSAEKQNAVVHFASKLRTPGAGRVLPILRRDTAKSISCSERLFEDDVSSSSELQLKIPGLAFESTEGIVEKVVALRTSLPEKENRLKGLSKRIDGELRMSSSSRELKDTLAVLSREGNDWLNGLDLENSMEDRLKLHSLIGGLGQFAGDSEIGGLLFSLVEAFEEAAGIELYGDRGLPAVIDLPTFGMGGSDNPRDTLVSLWIKTSNGDVKRYDSPFCVVRNDTISGTVTETLWKNQSLLCKLTATSGENSQISDLISAVVITERGDRLDSGTVLRLLNLILKLPLPDQSLATARQQLLSDVLMMSERTHNIRIEPDSDAFREICKGSIESLNPENYNTESRESDTGGLEIELLQFGCEESKPVLAITSPKVDRSNEDWAVLLDLTPELASPFSSLFDYAKLQRAVDAHWFGNSIEIKRLWKLIKNWVEKGSCIGWLESECHEEQDVYHPVLKQLMKSRGVEPGSAQEHALHSWRRIARCADGFPEDSGKTGLNRIRGQLLLSLVCADNNQLQDEVLSLLQSSDSQVSQDLELLVPLLPFVGLQLASEKESHTGRDAGEFPGFVFSESVGQGETVTVGVNIDENNVLNPISAKSAGRPPEGTEDLVNALLELKGRPGIECEPLIDFLHYDLAAAKMKGGGHFRQAGIDYFEMHWDALKDIEIDQDEDGMIYDCLDRFLKTSCGLKMYEPHSKREYGADWDKWIEVERGIGDDLNIIRPGLEDTETSRPHFRAKVECV